MEGRLDDIWMDVQGVELSVANTHHQIHRVEDEVIKKLSNQVTAHYRDFFTLGGAMESRFDGILDHHHERLNLVELVSGIVAEKCDNVREVLTSWMATFKVLELSVGDATTRVIAMEDHLLERSQSLVELDTQVQDQSSMIQLLKEQMDSQEATITALRDHVGELELDHHLLHDRIIAIKVRRSMVASDLWN